MNLGKVKSFLIVLFLGINIYLVISFVMSTRFYISKKTVNATADVLARNGITVNEKVITRSFENLKNIDANNIIYTAEFVDANKAGLFAIENDRFFCEKEMKSIHLERDGRIKKIIKELLSEYGFETSYMRFGNLKEKAAGQKELYIRCYIKGYRVFDSNIKVTLSEDKIMMEGTWYEPLTNEVRSRSKSRDTVYITSVLVSMIQNEEIMKEAPFDITTVDYGYLAATSYGEGVHVTTSALPYYRIKDNKGNVYYYDAKNGSYLK